jgi:hypothetical protein
MDHLIPNSSFDSLSGMAFTFSGMIKDRPPLSVMAQLFLPRFVDQILSKKHPPYRYRIVLRKESA